MSVYQFDCDCGRALETDKDGYVKCSGCNRRYQIDAHRLREGLPFLEAPEPTEVNK